MVDTSGVLNDYCVSYRDSESFSQEIVSERLLEMAKSDLSVFEGLGMSDLNQYLQGFALFRYKFGYGLNELILKTLENYPQKKELGSLTSLYGLCGSGKSLLVEGLKSEDLFDVFIDTDSVRFAVFSPLIKAFETDKGSTFDVIRTEKIYGEDASVMRKAYVDICAFSLRENGYSVAHTATHPAVFADKILYVEHPLARDLEHREQALSCLYEHTEARSRGVPDDYDWSHDKPVYKFESMPTVTVRVSEKDHSRILDRICNKFEPKEGTTIGNVYVDDTSSAQSALVTSFLNKQ